MIPSEFKCAGFNIKVIKDRKIKDNNYGYWNDALNEIHLTEYLEVDSNGETKDVKVTDEQLLNTFYHELIHCFNFYYNNEADEALAQVFANFLCEYKHSEKP